MAPRKRQRQEEEKQAAKEGIPPSPAEAVIRLDAEEVRPSSNTRPALLQYATNLVVRLSNSRALTRRLEREVEVFKASRPKEDVIVLNQLLGYTSRGGAPEGNFAEYLAGLDDAISQKKAAKDAKKKEAREANLAQKGKGKNNEGEGDGAGPSGTV
jgi:hypothetical protein